MTRGSLEMSDADIRKSNDESTDDDDDDENENENER